MRFIIVIFSFIVVGALQVVQANDENMIAALFSRTSIVSEQVYRKVDGFELKLDVYVPSKRLGEPPWVSYAQDRRPTLLYFHGGGWRGGDRISRTLELLPYVAKGWVVVTADYRLLRDATLPEAIGDCRAALCWVVENAKRFPIDTGKIVLAGNSAGGHLALMTGLVRDDAHYSFVPNESPPEIAAIINWYGITDVRKFTAAWSDKHLLIDDADRLEWVYDVCSPINLMGGQTPPIMTIHGNRDMIVPFDHAETLHRLLEKKGRPNQLLPIEGRKHGDFSGAEMTNIYEAIWSFLDKHQIK